MWKETKIERKASYRVAYKLKLLKTKIKRWTKEDGLKEEEKRNNILLEIVDLDRKEGEEGLSVDEVTSREGLRVEAT